MKDEIINFDVEFMNQDDPKTQQDIKDTFERCLMYLMTVDLEDVDFPKELRREIKETQALIHENSAVFWSETE